LDEIGRREHQEESLRHAAALSALRPGDSDAIAGEFNRHLDRVTGILRDFAARSAGVLAAIFLASSDLADAACCWIA
jgi:hypothetical protein